MFKRFLPVIIILFVTYLIFFKIFLRGLYPVPGDLLVSFYFPWYAGGWDGYNPWTTHKELLNADAIRQIFLWKELAMKQILSLNLPLWNPYTFSGQPLSANLQTGAFYPLNFLFLIFSSKVAWIILVVIQPFLAGSFMYLLLRSYNLSKNSSIFGSVAFMFTSYLITWMENVNVGHAYIWIPLVIYSINEFTKNRKARYLFLFCTSTSLSILAGHPQTAIYLLSVALVISLYKSYESNQKKIFYIFSSAIILSLGICALQILPTISLYSESPVSLPFSAEVFDKSILPIQNIITFFASDFFGHPANNNYWSFSYGDFTPYIGVIPLMLFIWAAFKLRKDRQTKLFVFIVITYFLAAIKSPITIAIRILHIPILDSTTPSRFISISIVFMIILAAFGFEDLLKNINNKKYFTTMLKFMMIPLAVYLILWIFATLGANFLKPADVWALNLHVTKRNLVLPTLSFFLFFFLIAFFYIKKFKKNVNIIVLNTIVFTLVLVNGVYFTNKFLPVAPLAYFFPDHPLFTWLKDNAQINRFYGPDTAYIDANFPTHYEIFGPEGYDTLRLKRYAELMASSKQGFVPQTYLRSDATFPQKENNFRKRLFELMGVKYLLAKEDMPKTEADWHPEKFEKDTVKGVWQWQKFQIYERQNVLPRYFLSSNFEVATSDNQITRNIYDNNFPLTRIILEEKPSFQAHEAPLSNPAILRYESNFVSFKTQSMETAMLFLSDSYAKGWKAFVDNKPTKILRADYAFRAVEVPSGEHIVTFKYLPTAFVIGIFISTLSIILLLSLSVALKKQKKF